jgi:hypothetical protein
MVVHAKWKNTTSTREVVLLVTKKTRHAIHKCSPYPIQQTSSNGSHEHVAKDLQGIQLSSQGI